MNLKTAEAAIRYSPAEREVFVLLPQTKESSVSSAALIERRYGAKAPYHAPSIIRAVISSLSKKIEANEEPFSIKKTPRAGPHHTSYWVERRETNGRKQNKSGTGRKADRRAR